MELVAMYLIAGIAVLLVVCCAALVLWRAHRQPMACPKCTALNREATGTCGVCGGKMEVSQW